MGMTQNLITQEEIIQILRNNIDEEQRDEIDYLQILNSATKNKNEYDIQLPNNKKITINTLTGETSVSKKEDLEVTQ